MANEMRMESSQQLRLEQRMKLTAQMIQSMEMLQLPLLVLQERIEQEIQANPVLEVRQSSEQPVEVSSPEDSDQSDDSERDLVIKDDRSCQEDFERLDNMESQFDPDELPDYVPRGTRRSSDDRDRKQEAMANAPAREISLHEYLIIQWHLVETDALTRRGGGVIINHIDDQGYLRTDFDQLAKKLDQSTETRHWEQALKLVQQLDPPGVGAGDLREALLLQLEVIEGHDGLVRQLVAEHLHDIELNRYPQIARKTGASIEQIKQAVQFIRTKLNPRPGRLIGCSDVPYIVPELTVEYDDQAGGYKVTLARGDVPNIYISRRYKRMLRDGTLDGQTKEFIRKNIRSARWLIESIQQRRNTIMRVAQAAVDGQRDFLDNGPQYLKPLPMTQVGQDLGIHVATVSRAVADKYIQTPRGIYPLRYFFSGGTETDDGQSISWGGIKAKLEQIIAGEDKSKPLSDDRIVEVLKDQGIGLARRTVAKYRQLLGISPARQRKLY